MNIEDIKPGDRVLLQVTGLVGTYEAVCVPTPADRPDDGPRFRALKDGQLALFTLKPGDYILKGLVDESP